jgi:pyruvate/2-oxoacid:ferredoxin oxidoreductase alpha subunit
MERLKLIAKLIGWFLWFTVALVFVAGGAGAAMGAATGNLWNGVIVMVGGGLLLVFGEIGRTMITKMTILVTDLQRAFKKAADSIEEQASDSKK